MSRLQNIIQSLCQTILSYCETQGVKGNSLEDLLKTPHKEFIESLQAIINEGTRGYRTRESLLNYFLFEINKLKPLIDRNSPLTIEESEMIQQRLQGLILNANKLLITSQSVKVLINYRNKNEEIPGFIRNSMKLWTLCNSGQLIQDEFIKPLGLQEYTETTVSNFLDMLITEHQLPFVRKENDALKKEIESFKKDKVLLESALEEVSCLKLANSILKSNELKLKEEKQKALSMVEELQKDKTTLEEEKKLLELAEQSTLEEVDRLKKEVSSLREGQFRKPISAFPSSRYYPFFNGVSGFNAILTPDSFESDKSRSPTFGSTTNVDD